MALPLPMAAAMAIATGAGAGGLGTWGLLATRAAYHPAVQQAALGMAAGIGDRAEQTVQTMQTMRGTASADTAWAFAARALVTAATLLLIAAMEVFAGGFAEFLAWRIAGRIRQATPDNGGPHMQDLAALAHQIETGGVQAQRAAALR